jgi:type IV secretory pathway VirB9-like protein
MFRFLMLVVYLVVAGCTLSDAPKAPPPPGPEDLSTWGTPELVPEPLRRSRMHVPPKADHKPTPAEKVYPYAPGGTYAVPVALGAPLDIQFMAGELIHNAIDSDRRNVKEGDEAAGGAQRNCQRWCFEKGYSGPQDNPQGHVFVTVTEAGLKNGLTITTTRGVYAITLESVKQSPIRFLRWTHEPEAVEVVDTEPSGPLPPLTGPSQWRVGYQATAPQRVPDWMPKQVVDDGKKIYVIYPERVLFSVVPLLRVFGPNGPMPVNGRQYLNVLIIDQLFARAEVRVGTGETAEVVTINRGTLRLVDCPGDPACPTWPKAAVTLQGGQS